MLFHIIFENCTFLVELINRLPALNVSGRSVMDRKVDFDSGRRIASSREREVV